MGQIPWDRRSELGLFRAFWQTAWGAVSRPVPLFRQAVGGGTVAGSLGYLLLCSVIALLPTMLFYAFAMFAMAFLSESPMKLPTEDRGMFAGVVGVYTVAMPLFMFAGCVVTAAVDHLVLKIAGVPGGFALTLRGLALSMGVSVFAIVPVCNFYVLPIWAAVVRFFAYRELHQTTSVKAAFGAFTSMAVCCLGCGGIYASSLIAALAHAPSR